MSTFPENAPGGRAIAFRPCVIAGYEMLSKCSKHAPWAWPFWSSGLVVFLGAHVFVTCRAPRAAVVARLGEIPYKALFALVSFLGLALVVYGFADYRAEGVIQIWNPPAWTRHVTVALVWPAVICVTAAYIRGNIQRVLKHPMLVGVKAVGGRASDRQRGSRRNHPVRFGPGLGGVRPHHAQAPQRSGRARRFQAVDAATT